MRMGLPDILSVSRIVGSILLLSTVSLSAPFLLIYGYCCLSDLADGYLARRDGGTSYGQVLDSTADIVLVICLLASLVPYLPWEPWMISWIAIIAVIRVVSLCIGSMRFNQIALLHTYGNKISALLRYLAPFMLLYMPLDTTMFVVCGVTTVSSVEDLAINLRSDSLDRNVKWFFSGKRDS